MSISRAQLLVRLQGSNFIADNCLDRPGLRLMCKKRSNPISFGGWFLLLWDQLPIIQFNDQHGLAEASSCDGTERRSLRPIWSECRPDHWCWPFLYHRWGVVPRILVGIVLSSYGMETGFLLMFSYCRPVSLLRADNWENRCEWERYKQDLW